jgi:hypothetical protein
VATGSEQLRSRVAQLDQVADGPEPDTATLDALLTGFVQVLEQSVNDGRPPATIDPAQADAITAGSRLLRRLDLLAPQLTLGPLDPDRQFWIATGKPQHVARPHLVPRASSFRPLAGTGRSPIPSTKPFGVGLFTATGLPGDQGMWRRYLDLNQGSSLHPRPWHVWRLTPSATVRVYEVASAAEWAGLLTRYPTVHRDVVFPDWADVAEDYDAIHLTLRAIAAVQGLSLTTDHGPSAATYWDVESVFWLHWSFTDTEPVETVDQHWPL